MFSFGQYSWQPAWPRLRVRSLIKIAAGIALVWFLAGQLRPTGDYIRVVEGQAPVKVLTKASKPEPQPTPAVLVRAAPKPEASPPVEAPPLQIQQPVRIEVSDENLAFQKDGVSRRDSGNWVEVTGRLVNIRAEPDARARRIGSYGKGTRLRVIERKDAWVHVRNPETSETGWMHGDYLEKSSRNGSPS